MRMTPVSAVVLAAGLLLPTLDVRLSGAQQQPPSAELPKSQLPSLGRPTKPTDPQPLLDFEKYFVGKWKFTWAFPESPLGPAGTLIGTTEYKKVDDKFFEATTEATLEGDAGAKPVKIVELYGYLREQHTISRMTTDSRGFSYTQMGTSGGDLGGFFTLFLESAPFQHAGHSVRLKTSTRLTSPLNHRTNTTMSVDGGPFTNFGSPWFEKVVPGATAQQR